MENLPSGERYLYQLFSLISVGHLKVINPQGQEFNFGDKESSPQLCLIVHDPNTYDRILTFGAMGFCEAYMEGWWDEEKSRLSELIGLFHTNGVYTKARSLITLPLLAKVVTQRLQTMPISIVPAAFR